MNTRHTLRTWALVAVAGAGTLAAGAAQAALVARNLDADVNTVEAYYDTLSNLTWFADVTAIRGTSYAYPGFGTARFQEGQAWLASLTLGGASWRLPTLDEVRSLMEVTLGNTLGLVNSGPFTGLGDTESHASDEYLWTGTAQGTHPQFGQIWFTYNSLAGYLNTGAEGNPFKVWAMTSGDVTEYVAPDPGGGDLPEPGSMALAGLAGVLLMARRRRRVSGSAG